MRRFLLPLPLFLAAACTTEGPAPTHASAGAEAGAGMVDEATARRAVLRPADGDCDLSTPLVPGVPGSPGHRIASARNPNGDSELSFLMRHFVDDLQQARAALERGDAPAAALLPVHRRMRCAWPTKPSERNEAYDEMARVYLETVGAFDRDPSKAGYNAVVQSCVSCHTMTCSSVIVAIDQLRWD
ncbi:MAG: hypothetical protein AB7O97_14150 [Planctomycetota bacterium]